MYASSATVISDTFVDSLLISGALAEALEGDSAHVYFECRQ